MTTRVMCPSSRAKPLRKIPRQRRSEQTRLDLLGGATRVLEERGAAGLTTNHIAERAGVSIGSLYQYYPNKAALLTDLHAEDGARLWGEVAPILDDPDLPSVVRIECVLEAVFVAQAAAGQHHAALRMAGIDPIEEGDVSSLCREFQDRIARLLVREHGRPPDQASDQAAFVTKATIGILLQIAREPTDAARARQLAVEAVRMFSAYLGISSAG